VVSVHGRRTDPVILRRLIAERGWTLSAFAPLAGVSRRHLMAVLAQDKDFSDVTVIQVADALGVPVSHFTVAYIPGADRADGALPPRRRSDESAA